jgi:hypothetical protein
MSLPAWTRSIAGRVDAIGEWLEQPVNPAVSNARAISDRYFFILLFKHRRHEKVALQAAQRLDPATAGRAGT